MLLVAVVVAGAILAGLPIAALASERAGRWGAALSGPFSRAVRAALVVATACAVLLLLVQIAVVVLVSVFSVSVLWLQESTAYLFGAVFLLGAGGVFLSDGHVRVDVLSSRWSARRRDMVDLTGIVLLLIPVCGLVVLVSVPWAARSWAALERSAEPSGLHLVFVLKTLVPLFALILALSGFVRAEAAARRLRRV